MSRTSEAYTMVSFKLLFRIFFNRKWKKPHYVSGYVKYTYRYCNLCHNRLHHHVTLLTNFYIPQPSLQKYPEEKIVIKAVPLYVTEAFGGEDV
jgi:hypothetical protein